MLPSARQTPMHPPAPTYLKILLLLFSILPSRLLFSTPSLSPLLLSSLSASDFLPPFLPAATRRLDSYVPWSPGSPVSTPTFGRASCSPQAAPRPLHPVQFEFFFVLLFLSEIDMAAATKVRHRPGLC